MAQVPASPKEATKQILNEIQTIFNKQFSGESQIKDLLGKITDEIKKSNVKAQVILKQQLGSVLTDMENMLDTEPSNSTSRARFLGGMIGSSKNRLNDDTQKNKVMEDLRRVEQKAEYLKEKEKEKELVGRKKEKEEIIDQLMLLSRSGDEGSPVPVIIIAGIAGIGKTQLARQVCQEQLGCFPFWVKCADYSTFDAEFIAKQVIRSVRAPSPKTVVILDDWRVEIKDEDLKVLQHKLENSRVSVKAIMITTRSSCLVARNIAAIPVKSYALPGLNEEESLCLFQTILGRDAADNSSITEDVRRIVGKCRGVPGAIMTMAKGLDSPRSKLIELTEELIYSYYDEGLPHSCFAYCSLFPQDHLFDAERLIHLWMAEGFLKPSTSSDSQPEDIGRGYLRSLVERSIFQPEEEDEFGEVRSCRMHPLMHDIARFVADREDISVDPKGDKVHRQVLRASFDLRLLDLSRGIPAPLFDKVKQLKTILFFAQTLSRLPLPVEMSTPVLENIFKSFKKLCVLDLRDLRIVTVPSSIGELKELEYLDLSHNDMEKLPSSIAKLTKLETLKLSRCYSLKELPKDFKNVVNLKHLDMEGCLSLTGMPREMSKLSSLQTLSAFVVNKKDPMGGLEELAKLNELRGHLEILYLDRVPQSLGNKETRYLKEKQHLERLTLRWDLGTHQEKSEQHLSLLDRLEPHCDLRILILLGYGGPSLSLTSIRLTRLVKLSLQDCPGCIYLSHQDQLPQLKILELVRLDNLEYVIAQNCDRHADFYKNLEELTIEDCPKLKSWWKTRTEVNDRPFFARISKLRVQHCRLLTCMPLYPRVKGSTSFGKEMFLEDSSLKLLLDTKSTRSSSENYSILLENLHIKDCTDLENMCDGFQHLSSLHRLTIENCKEINLDGPSNQWEGLKSLRVLTIREIPNLRSLSFGESVTTLRELSIHNCHELTSISDSISKVKSLRRLVISKCNKLKSLPIEMKELKSLNTLLILDCVLLLPRCQSNTGDDWLQISHIKHVQVK